MRVVTFGELLLRLTSPGYTKLFQTGFFESSFCGAEANVAVSLALLGVNSSFVTALPENEIGQEAANSIRSFGVDISNIVFRNGRMGLYYCEKGVSQRPSKVIYDREYSAIASANSTEFDWDKAFTDADWFHWTGINPAVSPNLARICEDACQAAKKRHLTISCDLNYREKLWTSEEAQKTMKPLMKYVDICICNEEDMEKTLGIKTVGTDIGRGLFNKDGYIRTAETVSQEYGCKIIATTFRKSYSASRNGWSAMLYDAQSTKSFMSTEYDIDVVDRVGGGDSFAAGLIYALAQKMEYSAALEFATAASCLKHTIEGDFNRTSVAEINALLVNGGNGRVQR